MNSSQAEEWWKSAGRGEEWRARVMDDDDWGMMKRPWDVSLILLSGVALLSLVLTSGLPPALLLCGPGFAWRWHNLTEEFRNVLYFFGPGWTETPIAIKKNSQFFSFTLPSRCFTLKSHYTTHAHHWNTCSSTTVQPQTGILWTCAVHWKLQQTYFQRFSATRPDPVTIRHNVRSVAHISAVFSTLSLGYSREKFLRLIYICILFTLKIGWL